MTPPLPLAFDLCREEPPFETPTYAPPWERCEAWQDRQASRRHGAWRSGNAIEVASDTPQCTPAPPEPDSDELLAVASTYSFRNRDEVMAFLRRNPSVPSMLLEAPAAINAAFGAVMPLSLSLHSYAGDGTDDVLVLGIQTNLEPEKAYAVLDDFIDAWWPDHRPTVRGAMIVDVEFI